MRFTTQLEIDLYKEVSIQITRRVVDKLEQLQKKYGKISRQDLCNYSNLYTKDFEQKFDDDKLYADVYKRAESYLDRNYFISD